MTQPSIEPMQKHQVKDAKLVICTVVHEIFHSPPTEAQALALLTRYEERGELSDMTDYENHYAGNGGLFLVLVDEGKVVGTGGIRKLDVETAELKRMWFLPEYRGRGFGRRMAEQLLHFARSQGYKRVRLDTDKKQHQAARLYERLGFKDISRYNDSICDRFMELEL